MKRQTRLDFDAAAVRDYLASFGGHPIREPEQGWASLVEEACNRLAMLEGIITLLRDTAEANRRATEACIAPLLGPYVAPAPEPRRGWSKSKVVPLGASELPPETKG